jgi:hypothetical protein
MATIISKKLMLNDPKERSLEVRQSRLKITPSNGSSFSSGDYIELKLPVSSRSYMDTNAMLMFSVASTGSVHGVVDTDGYSFFSKQTQFINGVPLLELPFCNVIDAAENSVRNSSVSQMSSLLKGSAGLENRPQMGKEISGNKTTFCLPMNRGIFSNKKRQFDLDTSASPVLNFYVETAARALVRKDQHLLSAALVPTAYSGVAGSVTYDPGDPSPFLITDVSLIVNVVQLSAAAQVQLDNTLGRQLYFDYEGVSVSAGTKQISDTSKTVNVSFNNSSLNRIAVIHQVADNNSDASQFSISNRSLAGLNSLEVNVSGINFPQQPLLMSATDCTEALLSTLESMDLLGEVGHVGLLNTTASAIITPAASATVKAIITTPQSNQQNYLRNYGIHDVTAVITPGVGTTFNTDQYSDEDQATNGTFYVSLDLRDFKNEPEDTKIRTGLRSVGGNTQVNLKYTSNLLSTAKSQDIKVVGFYSGRLVLNPESRAWEIQK